ncbi:AlpA family transcriptional regulator [Swaminathania salitolerans LMG 21291]|nr:AlpA family transcriptional regulator [Swaminathania salitolerans LMG 21291]
MEEAPEQAMTVRGVAAYLNVDEKTIYRLAKRGDLPGFKVAGAWRFKRSDLDGWIDLQKKAAQKSVRGETSERFEHQ